jgi:protocatechuate 3,4-dioxygenase beta subunit
MVRLSTELEGAPAAPDPQPAEAGVAHVDGLFPTSYEVRLSVSGHAPATRMITLKPGDRRRLEVKLEAGLSIEGDVTDSSGAPIPGAAVAGRAPDEEKGVYPVIVDTETDAQGHFVLAGLSEGRVSVDVLHDGYLNAQLEARTDGPALSVVLKRLATLDGQVLGVLGPARRVHLTLRGRADGGLDRSFGAASNEEGRYAFDFATEGAATLSAEVSEAGMATEVALELKPGANHFDLQLDPGDTISGRVLDQDQQPVAGAKVHTNPVGPRYSHRSVGSHSAVSDADGHFTLTAVDPDLGDYFVGASTATASTSPNARAHAGDTNVELHLQGRPRFTGRVVRVTGEPVTRFHVDTDDVSSPDGTFATWGWPGQRALSLKGPFLPVSVPVGDLDGGTADVGDVTVTEGIALRGQVLDHAGRPARSCRISARTDWNLDPPGIDPFREAPADSSAHFVLEHLPPAHYLISAHCDRNWVIDVPQLVTEGVAPITLSLPQQKF